MGPNYLFWATFRDWPTDYEVTAISANRVNFCRNCAFRVSRTFCVPHLLSREIKMNRRHCWTDGWLNTRAISRKVTVLPIPAWQDYCVVCWWFSRVNREMWVRRWWVERQAEKKYLCSDVNVADWSMSYRRAHVIRKHGPQNHARTHARTHTKANLYLSDLAPGKAGGPDSISSSELKLAAPLILQG